MPLDGLVIREGKPRDFPAIEQFYPLAFPDEDPLPLVRDLHAEVSGTLILVAQRSGSGAPIGHIVFTRCAAGEATDLYLLGPLAVAPQAQRQGVGKALIAQGIEMLRKRSGTHVFVLGDPAYYSRSGFTAERSIEPPYPLPKEWDGAWQSQPIHNDAAEMTPGIIIVPPVWDKSALWAA